MHPNVLQSSCLPVGSGLLYSSTRVRSVSSVFGDKVSFWYPFDGQPNTKTSRGPLTSYSYWLLLCLQHYIIYISHVLPITYPGIPPCQSECLAARRRDTKVPVKGYKTALLVSSGARYYPSFLTTGNRFFSIFIAFHSVFIYF